MPPVEERRVLVWRVGGALLAAPIEAVVEVAPVRDGTTRSRDGHVEIRGVPGLQADEDAQQAIILRAHAGLLAVVADAVEGVHGSTPRAESPTPAWLRGLPTEHFDGLLQLPDTRVAALLAVESLPG